MHGHGLVLSYHGKPVVHDGEITLRQGKVTALIGPNGSGKSTLLRALARLHLPDHGRIVLEDGVSAWTCRSGNSPGGSLFWRKAGPRPPA